MEITNASMLLGLLRTRAKSAALMLLNYSARLNDPRATAESMEETGRRIELLDGLIVELKRWKREDLHRGSSEGNENP